ncbi:hypothetical protein [Helicobacter cinaedi]|uniref:hypothetical protein n=1 Tax=Helicobacter cinaedi TaxID=213 RepID=UPI000D7C7256|nr:hypothetical protein [Helicobacter cinaedi]
MNIKNIIKFEGFSNLQKLLARVPEDWDWSKREISGQTIGSGEFQIVIWETNDMEYGFRVTHYYDEGGSSFKNGQIVYGNATYYLADERFKLEAEVNSAEEKIMAAIMPLLREDIESYLKTKRELHSL